MTPNKPHSLPMKKTDHPRKNTNTLKTSPPHVVSLAARKHGPALATAASFLLTCLPVGAQQYHSNDLTPAGSASGRLNGASGRTQVGAEQAISGYSHAVLLSGTGLP